LTGLLGRGIGLTQLPFITITTIIIIFIFIVIRPGVSYKGGRVFISTSDVMLITFKTGTAAE